MQGKPISRWLGTLLLVFISVVFGSNHIAARFAFEHGTNVATAVAFRSTAALLFVLVLLARQPGNRSRCQAPRVRVAC